MVYLKFQAAEQSLKRMDGKNIAAFARNELYAEFQLDDIWSSMDVVTAQFRNGSVCVDVFVENNQCLVPWEALMERGILEVCLIGGDLLTTNTVKISVLTSGVIGGLVPTEASPSVYSALVELAHKIEEDWNSCRELMDSYNSTVTQSQNTISSLINIIEEDFENVHRELEESKDNLNNAANLLAEIEAAVEEAKAAVNAEKSKAVAAFNENAQQVKDQAIADINSAAVTAKADIDISAGLAAESAAQAQETAAGIAAAAEQIEENAKNIQELKGFDNIIFEIIEAEKAKKATGSWQAVESIVKSGLGSRIFPIGTQLKTTHSEFGEIVWDVVAHNNNIDPTGASDYSMTLYTHDCIRSIVYDSPEAMYYCENGLEAGTYNFTLPDGYDVENGGGKTYQFTISSSVPSGGVIMFPWGYNKKASETKISIYASASSTAAIESVSVLEGSGGTALGTADGTSVNMNYCRRFRYGSNNWKESAVRQYLNNDEVIWQPQTRFDRPPSWANNSQCFINGFDEDFISAVGAVDNVTAASNIYEQDGNISTAYTTRDRFWLPSETEISGSAPISLGEGQLEYYANGSNDIRIKYLNGAASYYFLRSPNTTSAEYARRIGPNGSLSEGLAANSYGLAVACVIY